MMDASTGHSAPLLRSMDQCLLAPTFAKDNWFAPFPVEFTMGREFVRIFSVKSMFYYIHHTALFRIIQVFSAVYVLLLML